MEKGLVKIRVIFETSKTLLELGTLVATEAQSTFGGSEKTQFAVVELFIHMGQLFRKSLKKPIFI